MERSIKRLVNRTDDIGRGITDGLPICLGYLTVSFAFGLFAARGGMAPLTAAFLSLTNVTSAGQFAGTSLIFSRAPWLEIFLTTLLVNLRYMLMSLSLSQKLVPGLGPLRRLLIGYGVTDEIFAVAVTRPGELSVAYMTALMALPVAGWTTGTLLGALIGNILPDSLSSALGIALYAMFVAIIMPPSRQQRPVLFVVLLASSLSLAGTCLPFLRLIPAGWRLIACTIMAALTGAILAPIQTMPSVREDEHA